jgi:hypothetical protein
MDVPKSLIRRPIPLLILGLLLSVATIDADAGCPIIAAVEVDRVKTQRVSRARERNAALPPGPVDVSQLRADVDRRPYPPDWSRPNSPVRRTHGPEHVLRDQRADPLALTIASAGSDHIVAGGVFVQGDFAAVAV